MMKRAVVFMIVLSLLMPSFALAAKKTRSDAGGEEGAEVMDERSEEAAPVRGDEPQRRGPRPLSEEEYDRRMRSANAMITTGYILSGVGGMAAVAGSVYIAAKPDKRLTGAIIGASGLALGLAGGLVTIFGYHKRSNTEGRTWSIAPAVDPSQGTYALACSVPF